MTDVRFLRGNCLRCGRLFVLEYEDEKPRWISVHPGTVNECKDCLDRVKRFKVEEKKP